MGREEASENIPRWGLFLVLYIHDAYFYAFTFTERKATSYPTGGGRSVYSEGRGGGEAK